MDKEIQIPEVLKTTIDYNDKLIPAIEKTVHYFRTQREDQALQLLIPITDGLGWIYDVIFNTKDWLVEHEIPAYDEHLKQRLDEIVEALENQDYVLLADLLEYEIYSMLNGLQNGIKRTLD